MEFNSNIKQEFNIEGEDVCGEYIQFYFYGTLEQARIECEKTLDYAGGGHLDIFLSGDCDDQFIEDVEW